MYAVALVLADAADCSICTMSAESAGVGSLAVAVGATMKVAGTGDGPQALSPPRLMASSSQGGCCPPARQADGVPPGWKARHCFLRSGAPASPRSRRLIWRLASKAIVV